MVLEKIRHEVSMEVWRCHTEIGKVLKLSDNKTEIIFDVGRDFEYLIEKYMGYEVVQFFRELMNEIEEERQKVRSTRSDIESQTLDLISRIKDDREEIAEEFKAVMEDISDWRNEMSNRKLGNNFENELCETLFNHGFWCHNLAQNQAGQPADVIAARNRVAYLIDCKVCSGKEFPLIRVEENQNSAMTLWKDCGNDEGWFAIQLGDEIYMIPHATIRAAMSVKASLTAMDIAWYGTPLNIWIAKCR